MSKYSALKAAVKAVKESLKHSGSKLILTRDEYKEVVSDTAEDIAKFGEVYGKI